MDWTGGDGVQCGLGSVGNYPVPECRVYDGETSALLVRQGNLINLLNESLELYTETNVTVTFSDDPGNPVPLESLPRLS
jgi:hypothetical protein